MRSLRSVLAVTLIGALSSAASAQIGSTYCTANPNSSGSISAISAVGSTDVMLNDVTLQCGSLPTNAFGYFITSQTQAFVANPAGSAGNLCVGGQIGRYAGNILTSGTSGAVSLTINLNSMPAPTSTYSVMPGDTVNFQFWHRDSSPAGPTSNFSQGLEIPFDSVASGPTFENDIYPMLTQPNINASSCVTCHGGICGLDLSTAQIAFSSLVNVQSSCCFPEIYVVPNDPSSSVFYTKLTTPTCGSKMPLGGTFAGDPNVVRDWILAGAPF
ncbi:hypothetical protein Poly30_28890 [Planctomycetes bacterium Poly30]|uniref:Cytochrome c domain-containing protein n=1 Tax=Saltatorellus ferox TaxID=2528018 RepID=A0A518ETG0_9BACT|nr:hypothetical protein Poly30_28890 [Planctomycetes bacterium Poly30]